MEDITQDARVSKSERFCTVAWGRLHSTFRVDVLITSIPLSKATISAQPHPPLLYSS